MLRLLHGVDECLKIHQGTEPSRLAFVRGASSDCSSAQRIWHSHVRLEWLNCHPVGMQTGRIHLANRSMATRFRKYFRFGSTSSNAATMNKENAPL